MIASQANTNTEQAAGGADQVVGRIRITLADRIGEDSLSRYFDSRVRLDYAPGRLAVHTPTRFMANLLGRRFGDALRDAASEATGAATVEVSFDVDAEGPGVLVGAEAPAPRPPAPRRPGAGSRSGARGATPAHAPRAYRLEDFIVGDSNRLAYEAAVQFGSARDPNPANGRKGPATLFLHGACGMGKTHLVHGIAARYQETNPAAVVRVVTGETFTNEFISALRSGKGSEHGSSVGGLERFRRAFRRVDLLCIDDVHFLTSKTATQAELLHTFDELDLGGARIVLASDEHPRAVKKFSDALVSRFMAGLVTQVTPPDQALCDRLVRMMAQRRGLLMDDGVVRATVARIAPLPTAAARRQRDAGERRSISVRDIEGLMTRIEAYAKLSQDGVSGGLRRAGMAAVQQALGQQWGGGEDGSQAARRPGMPVFVTRAGESGRALKLEQIVNHVGRVLGVEFEELTGNGRRPQVVLARSLISYLARRLTTLSFPEIARGIGRPTHSTIIAACQRLEGQMAMEHPPRLDLGGTELTVKELCERMEGELGTGG